MFIKEEEEVVVRQTFKLFFTQRFAL